jgi:thymidylate kinase
MKGKLIAIYGINNIGKSTQKKLLEERCAKEEIKLVSTKVPYYELPGSGEIINDYLRLGNSYNLSSQDFQLIQIMNRFHKEPEIKKFLEEGINVLVEDYNDTGVAWGVAGGVDKKLLEELSKALLKEDVAIFLEGERFLQAVEEGHRHEQNKEMLDKVQKEFEILARGRRWNRVNANQTREEVHEDIWKIVNGKISR